MTSSHACCAGWSDFAWLKLLCLVLLSCSGTFSIQSNSQQSFHRCRSLTTRDNNETSAASLLEDLQQSSCQPCRYDPSTASAMLNTDDDDDFSIFLPPTHLNNRHRHHSLLLSQHMHVVVFLTTQFSFEKCMVTTSGLLTRGIRVTMLSAPNMPPESAIRPALAQHLPCDQQATAQSLLKFQTFYYNPQALPCLSIYGHETIAQSSSGDLIYCSIINAAPLVQAMSEALVMVDPQPSVLLMDATSVAGLLIAELYLIPSLMIVEHSGGLRHLLGDSLQHVSYWHPAYLYRLIQDRLISLDLTSAFIALNRVRQSLGLRRLRTMADLWRAPGNLLWSSMADARPWQSIMRNLLVYTGPFLPPCVPCDANLMKVRENMTATLSVGKNHTNSTITREPSVVVSAAFRDDENGRRQLRSLLNGLALARESIRHMNIACPTNSTSNCWRGPQDFRIVLTGPKMNDFLLPPFVSSVESAFLDILATFEPTVALVSLCDPGNSWTRSLGPPVLCLDLTWSPQELAHRLLATLRNNNESMAPASQPHHGDDDDVLLKIIHVLEEMSKVKMRDGENWSTGWEMGQTVMEQLNLPWELDGAADANTATNSCLPDWLLYPAYTIICCALLYLASKGWLWSMVLTRTRRLSRRHARMVLASLAHGLLSRLPEIDHAWTMWKSWIQEVSNQMSESTASALSPRGPNKTNGLSHHGSVENGSGHHRKRHKSTKKRS